MAGKKSAKILQFNKKNLAIGDISASIIENNAISSPSEPALDESALQLAVQRICYSGTYGETKHSKNDRSFRNISDDDILCCLQGTWSLEDEPKWHSVPPGNWKYKIRGTDIEGDELVLVIVVDTEREHICIITKY